MQIAFGSTLLDRDIRKVGIDGIGYYCAELLNQFKSFPDLTTAPFSFGLQTSNCRAALLPNYPSYLLGALANLKSYPVFTNADVIHATDQLIPVVRKKPLITTVMDVIPLSHPQFLRSSSRSLKVFLWKKLIQRSDRIITISEFSKQEIVNYLNYPLEKIDVTPLGVSDRYFDRIDNVIKTKVLAKLAIPPTFFLFIGSIQPRKNLMRLLEAHANLPLSLATEFPVVIAGKLSWDDPATLYAIQQSIEKKRVIWLDYVNEQDKLALLQSACGLTFPSLYEGFGLPIIEAFASSLPVLTSNCTAMPETAKDSAILIDPLDCDSIRNGLLECIQNESLCKELKEAGLKRARSFTWKSTAEKTLACYQQLI